MASAQAASERLLRDLSTLAGPWFYSVELEEHSFPFVNCSFSNCHLPPELYLRWL